MAMKSNQLRTLVAAATALKTYNDLQSKKEESAREDRSLDLQEGALELNKKKGAAQIKKLKADTELAELEGTLMPYELELQKKKVDIMQRGLKVREDLRALAIANAKADKQRNDAKLQVDSINAKRQLADLIQESEPGWLGKAFGQKNKTVQALEQAQEYMDAAGGTSQSDIMSQGAREEDLFSELDSLISK